MISAYDIEAIAFYFYNRKPIDILTDAYGEDEERHPSYFQEKYEDLKRGPHVLWSRLDAENKHRLAAAIMSYVNAKRFDPTAFDGGKEPGDG